MIKIIESPREAIQGYPHIIPAADKARYLTQLFRAGFDTVESGSIVSPKVIPQLADSLDVFRQTDRSGTTSGIMFLVGNERGAEIALPEPGITHLSYPFSFSAEFLRRNLNTAVTPAFSCVKTIINRCPGQGKQAVIYISMAFGNPYGDPWNLEMLAEWVGNLYHAGARIIPLSNVSVEVSAETIHRVFSTLIPLFPNVEFGLHLHTTNGDWQEKVAAAFDAGCNRFDSVINGLGGCPMTGGDLLANLKTENLLEFARSRNIATNISEQEFTAAKNISNELFKEY